MATPLSYDHRKLIVKLRKSGISFRIISDSTSIPYSTVKRIWYRYKKEGNKGLLTKYDKCGQKSPYEKSIKKRLIR